SSGVLEIGSGFTLNGGSLSGSTLSNGAIVKVDASGSTTNLVISSGTQEIVSASGTASATTGGASGILILSAVSATGVVINSGGTFDLLNGSAYTIGSVTGGGMVEVGSGLTVGSFTGLGFGNGGIIKVDTYGSTTNLVISSGTQEIVSSGGSANATT